MKKIIYMVTGIILLAGLAFAESDRGMNLSSSPDPAIVGKRVTFTCQATGEWRNDRITKAQVSVYNAAGTRMVNLATMSINGESATYNYTIGSKQKPGAWRFQCKISDGSSTMTKTSQFTVVSSGTSTNHPPVANPGGPYTGTTGQAVSFTGSGSTDPDGNTLTYSWNFGDSSTGTGVSPTHTYAAAGTYTVSLTVNDGHGGTNSNQTTATIASAANRPPVANAGGPYTGTAGQAVTFTGSGSTDPDGNTLTYSWNFGDSSTGTGVSPTHTYAAAGTYTVILTVNDGHGGTNSNQTTATIASAANRPPVANAGGPYTGTAGQAVTFTGSGSTDPDGNTLTYSWNFGDSSTGTGVSPTHTYAAAGTFTVILTVNDGHGGTNSNQTTATIASAANRPPVANAGGPYTGTAGQAVTFTGSGSTDPDGNTLTYSWNFGDSSTGTGVSPTHTYAAAGTFTVILTVNDGHGGTNSNQTTATIASAANRPPVANAGGPYTGTAGQAVTFTGSGSTDPDGNTLTYSWNFGDSSTGTGVSPTHTYAAAGTFTVILTVNDGHGGTNSNQTTAVIIASGGTGNAAHASIQSYNGPATCIACHPAEAQDMLTSLHVKWSGPTPNLTNGGGRELGKQIGGINTFCTYAVSSKNACYNCHVRTDGNANHPATVNDVDCLMCHSDVYARKFDLDPNNTLSVQNVLGQTMTYEFSLMDAQGNYVSEPDFANMPSGTTMAGLAQTVSLPTRKACLKCHAKSGGGDWTKRGDMGLNTENPTVDQDFHMSPAGGNLTCADCHAVTGHRIGGRGIDLRETEAPAPQCTNCHTAAPHTDATLNRHAAGQVGCQVCHIRTFGKGGATEMARDWTQPHWDPAFCNGQGGFVGLETKIPNDLPEYRFFDGTSYVYNVGDTISPNADGTYTMAKAHGAIFDGKSKIVPIKDHWSNEAITTDGRIVPPVIYDMFMTGYFDQALQAGMTEQQLPGTYKMIQADAEMLITHGVEPKTNAPACADCHNGNGTSDLMIPFTQLGYHNLLPNVATCTACHSKHTASWQSVHDRHVTSMGFACTRCHSAG